MLDAGKVNRVSRSLTGPVIPFRYSGASKNNVILNKSEAVKTKRCYLPPGLIIRGDGNGSPQ